LVHYRQAPFSGATRRVPQSSIEALSDASGGWVMSDAKRYLCRRCGLRPEVYRAVGNVPRHGHLCKECFGQVLVREQIHYVKLEDQPAVPEDPKKA
jgi:hypothetical protein